jgi:hypothetical protein
LLTALLGCSAGLALASWPPRHPPVPARHIRVGTRVPST